MRTSTFSFSPVTGLLRQRSLVWRDWPPALVSDISPEYYDGYVALSWPAEREDALCLNHYETKVSVSTPGWNSLEQVKGITYKPGNKKPAKTFKEPTVPVNNPPRFVLPPVPALKIPFKDPKNEHQRVANANALRKFGKRKKHYRLLAAKRETVLKQYAADFERRLVKYKLRYAAYLDYRRRSKNPKVKRGVLTTRPYPPPMNPFKKIILQRIGSGADGPWLVSDTASGTIGPHVMNVLKTPVSIAMISSGPPSLGAYSVSQAIVDDVADGMVAAVRSILSDVISEMDGKLVKKFYDKLSNQKVHIGNIIAERAQTLDLLRSAILGLKSLIGVKKGVIKSIVKAGLDPIKTAKRLSNNYLAFQFGVQPLLSDIYASVEILRDPNMGTDTIAIRTNSTKYVSLMRNGASVAGRLSRSYVYYFSVSSDLSRSLNSFGLVNPAEIAWEVLPWSFVVDWLLPVGTFISSLTSLTGITFVSGVHTEKFLGTYDSTPTQVDLSLLHDGQPHFQVYGNYGMSYTIREVVSSPPDAYTMLQLKSPISWTHGLESLALTVQKLFKSFH